MRSEKWKSDSDPGRSDCQQSGVWLLRCRQKIDEFQNPTTRSGLINCHSLGLISRSRCVACSAQQKEPMNKLPEMNAGSESPTTHVLASNDVVGGRTLSKSNSLRSAASTTTHIHDEDELTFVCETHLLGASMLISFPSHATVDDIALQAFSEYKSMYPDAAPMKIVCVKDRESRILSKKLILGDHHLDRYFQIHVEKYAEDDFLNSPAILDTEYRKWQLWTVHQLHKNIILLLTDASSHERNSLQKLVDNIRSSLDVDADNGSLSIDVGDRHQPAAPQIDSKWMDLLLELIKSPDTKVKIACLEVLCLLRLRCTDKEIVQTASFQICKCIMSEKNCVNILLCGMNCFRENARGLLPLSKFHEKEIILLNSTIVKDYMTILARFPEAENQRLIMSSYEQIYIHEFGVENSLVKDLSDMEQRLSKGGKKGFSREENSWGNFNSNLPHDVALEKSPVMAEQSPRGIKARSVYEIAKSIQVGEPEHKIMSKLRTLICSDEPSIWSFAIRKLHLIISKKALLMIPPEIDDEALSENFINQDRQESFLAMKRLAPAELYVSRMQEGIKRLFETSEEVKLIVSCLLSSLKSSIDTRANSKVKGILGAKRSKRPSLSSSGQLRQQQKLMIEGEDLSDIHEAEAKYKASLEYLINKEKKSPRGSPRSPRGVRSRSHLQQEQQQQIAVSLVDLIEVALLSPMTNIPLTRVCIDCIYMLLLPFEFDRKDPTVMFNNSLQKAVVEACMEGSKWRLLLSLCHTSNVDIAGRCAYIMRVIVWIFAQTIDLQSENPWAAFTAHIDAADFVRLLYNIYHTQDEEAVSREGGGIDYLNKKDFYNIPFYDVASTDVQEKHLSILVLDYMSNLMEVRPHREQYLREQEENAIKMQQKREVIYPRQSADEKKAKGLLQGVLQRSGSTDSLIDLDVGHQTVMEYLTDVGQANVEDPQSADKFLMEDLFIEETYFLFIKVWKWASFTGTDKMGAPVNILRHELYLQQRRLSLDILAHLCSMSFNLKDQLIRINGTARLISMIAHRSILYLKKVDSVTEDTTPTVEDDQKNEQQAQATENKGLTGNQNTADDKDGNVRSTNTESKYNFEDEIRDFSLYEVDLQTLKQILKLIVILVVSQSGERQKTILRLLREINVGGEDSQIYLHQVVQHDRNCAFYFATLMSL